MAASYKRVSKSQLVIRFVWDGCVSYLRNIGIFGGIPKTYEMARGERWQSEEELFGGLMDDVRIYDRALSAGEVLYLSNM